MATVQNGHEMQNGNGTAPSPSQIVLAHDDHTFTLDENALSDLLLRKDIVNKKVVIVSVAGAFRKGKSFLLDFMLRYLRAGENMSQADLEKGDWMGEDGQPLTGFHWRGGSERDTTGILVWNEPFFRKLPSGEEVAILVMDTQGAFDTQSTVKDCATVFALSTMISSVQVYNLSANIQEDDLQHLQLFTEYGRLAMEKTKSKPFQQLVFLVRDWSFPYESDYGLKGGIGLLDRRLQISDKQHPELQSLRKHIRSCFESIQCFLMPHPGLKVATNPKFDGRLSDIEPEFKKCLVEFFPIILSPERLLPKEINGQKITGGALLEYFKAFEILLGQIVTQGLAGESERSHDNYEYCAQLCATVSLGQKLSVLAYIKIYQSDTLPEPKSMLEATAEANNLSAVNAARELYMEEMEKTCGGDMPYLNPQSLEHEHTVIQGKAVQRFHEIPKMGGDEFSASYLKKLEDDVRLAYDSFVRHNESKNFFSSFRTPATLFVFVVALYVLSGFLELVGMQRYANFFALTMGVFIAGVVTWGVCRLTGQAREVGQTIDEVATFFWENILSPLTQQAGQRVANAYPQYQHMANIGNFTANACGTAGGGGGVHRSESKKR